MLLAHDFADDAANVVVDDEDEDDDDNDVVHTPAPSRPTSSTSKRTNLNVSNILRYFYNLLK